MKLIDLYDKLTKIQQNNVVVRDLSADHNPNMELTIMCMYLSGTDQISIMLSEIYNIFDYEDFTGEKVTYPYCSSLDIKINDYSDRVSAQASHRYYAYDSIIGQIESVYIPYLEGCKYNTDMIEVLKKILQILKEYDK